MIGAGAAAELVAPSPRHRQGLSKSSGGRATEENKGRGRKSGRMSPNWFFLKWSTSSQSHAVARCDVTQAAAACGSQLLLFFLLFRPPPRTHDEQTDHSCSGDKKGGSCGPTGSTECDARHLCFHRGPHMSGAGPALEKQTGGFKGWFSPFVAMCFSSRWQRQKCPLEKWQKFPLHVTCKKNICHSGRDKHEDHHARLDCRCLWAEDINLRHLDTGTI